MQHYKNYQKGVGEGSESLVLLSPEQIRLEGASAPQRNEQNAVIRLANSIKKYGILEPISVLPRNDRGGFLFYELIDGERRYRAALVAGLKQLPAVILSPDDVKCQKKAAVLQLLGEGRHYLDLAQGIATLMRDFDMTQEEIARKIGLSQSAVANKLRLLQLPLEERLLLMRMQVGERHARALLRLKNAEERKEMLAAILKSGLTVGEVERMIDAKTHSETLIYKNNVPFIENKDAFLCKSPPFQALSLESNEEPHHVTFQERALRNILDAEQKPIRSEREEKARTNPPGAHKASMTSPPPTEEPSQAFAKISAHTRAQTPSQAAPPVKVAGKGTHITPSKFALRDLRPLYNSIERTLGIFEKTGVSAEYSKEEDDTCAKITIHIPKKQA